MKLCVLVLLLSVGCSGPLVLEGLGEEPLPEAGASGGTTALPSRPWEQLRAEAGADAGGSPETSPEPPTTPEAGLGDVAPEAPVCILSGAYDVAAEGTMTAGPCEGPFGPSVPMWLTMDGQVPQKLELELQRIKTRERVRVSCAFDSFNKACALALYPRCVLDGSEWSGWLSFDGERVVGEMGIACSMTVRLEGRKR